ncbi:MAG: pentapeptide repeat-containing protein [Pseudomonadota bacterium]
MTWYSDAIEPDFAILLLVLAFSCAALLLINPIRALLNSPQKRQAAFSKLIWVGGAAAIGLGALLFILSTVEILSAFLIERPGPEDDFRWLSLLFLGVLGAPFVIWRSMVAQQQANIAQSQWDIAEQGMITDRINQAVAALGAEKTKVTTAPGKDGRMQKDERTVPNTEVRIGGLYALARIAEDSARDHVKIMKIICAFIRNNAGPLSTVKEMDPPPDELVGEDADHAGRKEAGEEYREELAKWRAGLKQPDEIRIALEVLSDRTAKQRRLEMRRDYSGPADIADFQKHGAPGLARALRKQPAEVRLAIREALGAWKAQLRAQPDYRPDLRGADLRGADLSELDLQHARLENAEMQGADLWGANMQGAVLLGAEMQGADLTGAKMQGAVLRGAKMQGAVLFKAEMQGAVLLGAEMQGAVLRGANMQGADLVQAEMQGADLWGANMQGADLEGATLKSTDLRRCRMGRTRLRSVDFTQDTQFDAASLENAFGVKKGFGRVKLPEGVAYPAHWHEAAEAKEDIWELDHAFNAAYEEWAGEHPLPKTET